MQIRTDLALEQKEMHSNVPNGVKYFEKQKGNAHITEIFIETSQGAKALAKPLGRYITVEVPPFSDNVKTKELSDALTEKLEALLPQSGSVLVVGLGNRDITPDALGPKTASRVLATRHIEAELAKAAGIYGIRSVAVISPGVLGQTGIEAFDQIKGVCKSISPSAIIIIDALASRYLKRLGCTVQITDSGIAPGAGVGNARVEISRKTLGVPVIAIGVPTVVEAATLVADLTGNTDFSEPDNQKMIVTPKEVDLLVERAAILLSEVLNKALHPKIDTELLNDLLG